VVFFVVGLWFLFLRSAASSNLTRLDDAISTPGVFMNGMITMTNWGGD